MPNFKEMLKRKKSRLFDSQPGDIPTSYHQSTPNPPYPSSIRPTSVFEPPMPTFTRPAELDGHKANVWSADGFQILIQRQKQEEIAARRRADAEELERKTMLHAQKVNMDEEERRQKAEAYEQKVRLEQNASAARVRHLRELIRKKYQLDLYVWNKRDVQKASRKLIMKDCVKADAILQEIIWIVSAWDESLFDAEDWKVAKKIKESLVNQKDHAFWENLPPWDRPVNGEH